MSLVAHNNGSNGKVGRPTLRTEENAEIIFQRLILGESLVSICEDEKLPSYCTVVRWLQDDEEFRKRYSCARKYQAQYLEHKGMEIIMSADVDTAYLAKVQFDALRWQMARLNPVVYGEKQGDVHVTSNVNNFVVLPVAERERLVTLHREALQR